MVTWYLNSETKQGPGFAVTLNFADGRLFAAGAMIQWRPRRAKRGSRDGGLSLSFIKVQGDNRGSFIVVTKRLSNMTKNLVSIVLVEVVAIFHNQVELVAKNCDHLLQD